MPSWPILYRRLKAAFNSNSPQAVGICLASRPQKQSGKECEGLKARYPLRKGGKRRHVVSC
jgi:hypothetical protein